MQGNGHGPNTGNGSTTTRTATPRPEGLVAAPEGTPFFVGAPPATIRPRRKIRFDYRLRGLDLHAPVFAEAASGAIPRPRHSRHRRIVLWWLAAFAVAAAAAVGIRATMLTPFTVPSNSMMPTLHAGDRIVVVKSSLLQGSIQRGTLVVFRQSAVAGCSASTNSQDLVQRVIGLPGDSVSSDGSTLLVNGSTLHETGWYDTSAGPVGTTSIRFTTVPPDSYLVLNDNRADACDSRAFGTIARSQIVGTVFMVATRHGHPSFHIF